MRRGYIRWVPAVQADRPEVTAFAPWQDSTAFVSPPAEPTHDPPLTPRDEVIFLLHTAAEIEHALLVQYLYAAFSFRDPDAQEVPPDRKLDLRRCRQEFMEIAEQEMGHLATIQNLLRAIGGPVNF